MKEYIKKVFLSFFVINMASTIQKKIEIVVALIKLIIYSKNLIIHTFAYITPIYVIYFQNGIF